MGEKPDSRWRNLYGPSKVRRVAYTDRLTVSRPTRFLLLSVGTAFWPWVGPFQNGRYSPTPIPVDISPTLTREAVQKVFVTREATGGRSCWDLYLRSEVGVIINYAGGE